MDPSIDDFNMQAAVKLIEEKNPVKVACVIPLMCKPKNPGAPMQLVVVFTKNRAHADHLILRNVKIGSRTYEAKKYMPQHQLTQCYKCQGYRHRSEVCTRQQRCGCCAGDHATKECRKTDVSHYKCAACQGNHMAWDDKCPKRIDEIKQLKHLRKVTPPTFSPPDKTKPLEQLRDATPPTFNSSE